LNTLIAWSLSSALRSLRERGFTPGCADVGRAARTFELIDQYLRFVAARSRPNKVLATAYDLKVFFSVNLWLSLR
jgi:hypothetical protein